MSFVRYRKPNLAKFWYEQAQRVENELQQALTRPGVCATGKCWRDVVKSFN